MLHEGCTSLCNRCFLFPAFFCTTGTLLFCMSGNHGSCLHDIPTILCCSVVDYNSSTPSPGPQPTTPPTPQCATTTLSNRNSQQTQPSNTPTNSFRARSPPQFSPFPAHRPKQSSLLLPDRQRSTPPPTHHRLSQVSMLGPPLTTTRSSLCFTHLDVLLPNGHGSVFQFGVITVYIALALFSSHDYRKITGIT